MCIFLGMPHNDKHETLGMGNLLHIKTYFYMLSYQYIHFNKCMTYLKGWFGKRLQIIWKDGDIPP